MIDFEDGSTREGSDRHYPWRYKYPRGEAALYLSSIAHGLIDHCCSDALVFVYMSLVPQRIEPNSGSTRTKEAFLLVHWTWSFFRQHALGTHGAIHLLSVPSGGL